MLLCLVKSPHIYYFFMERICKWPAPLLPQRIILLILPCTCYKIWDFSPVILPHAIFFSVAPPQELKKGRRENSLSRTAWRSQQFMQQAGSRGKTQTSKRSSEERWRRSILQARGFVSIVSARSVGLIGEPTNLSPYLAQLAQFRFRHVPSRVLIINGQSKEFCLLLSFYYFCNLLSAHTTHTGDNIENNLCISGTLELDLVYNLKRHGFTLLYFKTFPKWPNVTF